MHTARIKKNKRRIWTRLREVCWRKNASLRFFIFDVLENWTSPTNGKTIVQIAHQEPSKEKKK